MDGPAEVRGGQATATLEQRVRRLEARLDAVIDAVEVLARGLEDGPLAEPAAPSIGTRAGDAARRTHELLLLAKSAEPEQAEQG